MKYLPMLMVIFVILVSAVAEAQPPGHIAFLCTSCHQKFSYQQPYAQNLSVPVKNSHVINEFPCYKHECHYSAPGQRVGNRYSLHMSKPVCKNCHLDIHTVHRDEVNCKICHLSPRGWNSSIAIVPAPTETMYYEGIMIGIPRSGECKYCHLDVSGARRLHEVHKQVLNRTCADCHGKAIESRTDLIARITGIPLPEEKRVLPLPIREFSRLFDEIAREFMGFAISVRVK
jgi:hypothetical protein